MEKPQSVLVDVPMHVLVNAFLDKMRGTYSGVRELPASAIVDDCLPDIGMSTLNAGMSGPDGMYAGKTLHDNQFHALILLPGDEEMPWEKAVAWAKERGGELPTRMDMLVLWQNLPKEFKETYYWTSETNARNGDSAWFQSFGDGFQDSLHESFDVRCRAVRRVAI